MSWVKFLSKCINFMPMIAHVIEYYSHIQHFYDDSIYSQTTQCKLQSYLKDYNDIEIILMIRIMKVIFSIFFFKSFIN